MKPHLEYPAPDNGYWIGTDDAGRHFAAVPMIIGNDEFDSFYEVDAEQHARFLSDRAAALAFVEECRHQQHDDVLRFGWRREAGS